MVDWGSVPDWFAGLGAAAALVFARAAARSARDANRAQQTEIRTLQDEQAARDEQSARDQATRVAVWLDYETVDDPPARAVPVVWVTNGNTIPVYGLTIHVRGPGGTRSERYMLVPPHTTRKLARASAAIQAVASEGRLGVLFETEAVRSACSFRDSIGAWWCRGATGELVRAQSGEQASDLAARSVAD